MTEGPETEEDSLGGDLLPSLKQALSVVYHHQNQHRPERSTRDSSTAPLNCHGTHPREQQRQQQREEYVRRLLSFRPSTYYAKPACLSPVIFARFGWRNAESDMLCCVSCKAVMAVFLPEVGTISWKYMDQVCSAYRKQLASAHHESCDFRLPAEQFLRRTQHEQQEGDNFQQIPSAMASVLPSSLVEYLESPSIERLKKRVQSIQDAMPQNYRLPKLDVDLEIQGFRDGDLEQNGMEFLSEMGRNSKSYADIVFLALLGWTPVGDIAGENKRNQCSTMGCPLCLSTIVISLQTRAEEEDERPSKKSKSNARSPDPLQEHRHYCPMKCGFPNSVFARQHPLWKTILRKLMLAKKTERRFTDRPSSSETNYEGSIRRLLVSGVHPKKVEISSEDLCDSDEDKL